jgi:MFS transporter, SHS family, lactate transporter
MLRAALRRRYSITLTLLFRPLGAIIFGLLSDRYGRKWPLIANLLACAVLSLGTGFANDYGAFLAVRSLFGIAMGGIWGQVSTLRATGTAPKADLSPFRSALRLD